MIKSCSDCGLPTVNGLDYKDYCTSCKKSVPFPEIKQGLMDRIFFFALEHGGAIFCGGIAIAFMATIFASVGNARVVQQSEQKALVDSLTSKNYVISFSSTDYYRKGSIVDTLKMASVSIGTPFKLNGFEGPFPNVYVSEAAIEEAKRIQEFIDHKEFDVYSYRLTNKYDIIDK